MNYNDVNIRLKRIYASIDRKNRYGGEVLSGMHTDKIEEPSGKSMITVSFGNDTEALNQIHEVISNLANLKDCLKDRMVEQGKEEKLIEEDIDRSPALQLVLDLSNQEKHGYPLKRHRRSKKDPQIKNIRFGMSPSNKPNNVTYSASDGSSALNVMVSIHADIVDCNGIHLYAFDKLVEQAIADWELTIKKYQIT